MGRTAFRPSCKRARCHVRGCPERTEGSTSQAVQHASAAVSTPLTIVSSKNDEKLPAAACTTGILKWRSLRVSLGACATTGTLREGRPAVRHLGTFRRYGRNLDPATLLNNSRGRLVDGHSGGAHLQTHTSAFGHRRKYLVWTADHSNAGRKTGRDSRRRLPFVQALRTRNDRRGC